MKKSIQILANICLVILFTCVTAFAQDAKLDLSSLSKLEAKASENTDIVLDGKMLEIAGKFITSQKIKGKNQDVEKLKAMLMGLKGIYVKTFEFDKAGEFNKADLDPIREKLKSPGWTKMVGVTSKKDGENTEVYIMRAGENIVGLAIIAAEQKELTIVNIVGPIDIEALSSLQGNFGIPSLGGKEDKEY